MSQLPFMLSGKFGRNRTVRFSGNLAASLLALSFITFPRATAAPTTGETVPAQATPHPSEVQIFYITNRLVKKEGKLFYTYERSDELGYGVRDVKFQSKSDGKKITYEKSAKTSLDLPKDDFFARLSKAQKDSNTKQVVVYVHGYDCSIDVASRVAAKLGTELQLPILLFSWPSRRNPLTYTADECNAEWSSFQLSDVLEDLAKRVGANNIILVGHSMGCRILCWSLQHSKAVSQAPAEKYRHVLLCSPDIDAQVFHKYSQIFASSSDDTRVFASYRDVRLIISKLLHGGIRLGSLDAARKHEPVTVNNDTIQTIDYTDDDPTVFGHAIPYHLLKQAVQPAATVSR